MSASDSAGRYRIATIPNALCFFSRIAMSPVIGAFVLHGSFSSALSLFAVASVTDMLDGYIARRWPSQQSLLGSVIDPIADKLLVGVLFVTSTYVGLIPVALTGIVLLRDVCLVVGGFIKRYETMERPITLSRFFDPQVSSIQIVPTFISKLNTVLQLGVVTASLAAAIPSFASPELSAALIALYWTTAGTTVWSGVQYASGRALKRV